MVACDCEGNTYHQERRNQPVHDDGKANLDPKLLGLESEMQRLEFYFAQDRIHHNQQTDGERSGDIDEFALLQGGLRVGYKISYQDADYHGEENPDGQKAVEPAETFKGGDFVRRDGGFDVLLLNIGRWVVRRGCVRICGVTEAIAFLLVCC